MSSKKLISLTAALISAQKKEELKSWEFLELKTSQTLF
jgi:hypothetical protein